ncbi:T9SS type A sorting domain-containing protein [Bacteroides sp.]
MKEQITTWLFLLLLGSGYNIEPAQSQNVINEFPAKRTESESTLIQSVSPTLAYTYQWEKKNGQYTLSGTGDIPLKAITTYQLPSFYFSQSNGQSIYLTIQNLNGSNDEISLIIGDIKRVLSKEGDQKIEMPYDLKKEGLTTVYLQAIHGQGSASNVVISNYVSPIDYAYPVESASNIYDINGDGKMEFLVLADKENIHGSVYDYSYQFASYNYPGLDCIPDKVVPGGTNTQFPRLCNLSNKPVPDLRYLTGGNIAISQSDGNWLLQEGVVAPYPCDYNNDGKPDLMESQHFVYRQTEDGTFSRTEIIPVSSEEDTLSYNRWESNFQSSGIGLGNLGGDVGVPIGDKADNKIASFKSSREYYSMDFNKDGYEDLIDEQTGAILLNRGNNRFLYAPQEGMLYPRDLNGDYITDYVVYDKSDKIVSTIVFNKDGSIEKQTLMSNLTMDEDIYFYDFDNDGDIDILLPFSNSTDIGEYSYLVLCVNDGKGHFKINENNTYRKKLHFIACADIDNDGYYDVLALDAFSYDDNQTLFSELYCLKGTSNLTFTELSEPIIKDAKIRFPNNKEAILGDFDGDGIYDMLLHSQQYDYSWGEIIGYLGASNSRFFRFNGVASSDNKAPNKPASPTIVSDPAAGMLKINWELGKDDKSPSIDLTYALRIGSESGKGDIFYANADVNGRRLNILPGNMGYNLDKTLNVSGWKKGNYYIAIQAIDPMGKGSAWSDEVVYKHEVANAAIFISNKSITTGDTLMVAYDGITDPTCTYTWNLDGGEIIESNAEKSQLQVIFNSQGSKSISLQVTDADGNISPSVTNDVHVYPVRFDDKGSAYIKDIRIPYIMNVSDTDNNGTLEFITTDGVYSLNDDNLFEKSPGIFNTNLEVRTSTPIDFNRDGLIDFIGNFNPSMGDDAPNLLINLGNNRFEVSKKEQLMEQFNYYGKPYKDYTPIDFNNDGYPDFIEEKTDTYYHTPCTSKIIIHENGGDWNTFIPHQLFYIGPEENTYLHNVYYTDINNDNLTDVICSEGIYLNKGNFEFEWIEGPISAFEKYVFNDEIHRCIDLNNDGIKDLYCVRSYNGYLDYHHAYIYFSQNGKLTYPANPTEIPNIAGYFADIDNNGYMDIVASNMNQILYMYPNEQNELYTYETNRDNNEGSWGINWHFMGIYYPLDLNGDGKPDYVGECNGLKIVNNTRITNTVPEIPQNLRAIQDDEGFITVEWDPARDNETPFVQMRYNLSIKKQGATGEGAFIVSPMNELSNEAKTIPANYEYLRGTQYRIPISVIPVGKYEVQIQSIDAWNISSNFSEPFILEVTPKPLLNLPKEICQNKSAVIRYNGTITDDIQIDWGEADLLQDNGDNSYEVVWTTSGIKALKVTSAGVTTSVSFLVKAPIDASFSLPVVTIADTETSFNISDDIFLTDRSFEFAVTTTDDIDHFYTPARFGISFEHKKNTKEVKAIFKKEGNYVVRLTVNDSGCGGVISTKNVTVKKAFAKPQISLISIDKETGKNQINWQFKDLPDYVTNVMIYKETNHYNQFELIGEVAPSANHFIDMTSNPAVTTSRYQIRLNTSFGVTTDPGNVHQSLHLTINKGMGDSWNLMWSKYEGATIDNYRILRGLSADNMQEIASVSGSVSSYSDINAPEGLLYYAIEYSTYYEDEWEPMSTLLKTSTRSTKLVKAESNIVNIANAQNVTFVDELYIRHLEEEIILNDDQQTLHLYADVYPVTAAYKNVNWTITQGEDLAYITNKGLLVANSTKGGNIVVRATAIDGSGTYAEITVPMSGIIPDNVITQNVDEMIIYPSPVPDLLFIKGIPLYEGKAIVSVISMSGQCMFMKEVRTEETEISCSNYPTGIYLLRIVSEDKVITRRFMKK